LRVLIVDDNDNAAQSTALLLRCAGLEARVANDGPAALAAAREWAPQAVLLDIGLPGMDGLEVARQLRAGPAGAALRLVALTGLSDPADRQRALEAGVDEYLIKPAPPGELLRAVSPAECAP
jgi:CheY-like chemotaxis protein